MTTTTAPAAVTLDTAATVKDSAFLLGFDAGRSMQTLGETYATLVKGADAVRLNQIRENFMLGAVAERLFPNVTRAKLNASHVAAASLARTTTKSAQTPEQIRANGAARKRWYTILKINDVAAPAENGGGANNTKKADAPKADAQSVTTTEAPKADAKPTRDYAKPSEGHAYLMQELSAIRAKMDKHPTAFTSNMIKIIDVAVRNMASLKLED
jgi:hypothetical protein